MSTTERAVSSSEPETTRADAGVREALTALHRLAQVHNRPDLAESVESAQRRLSGTGFRIVVMGEYKQGKSSLINALVDAPVCAVDDDIATATRLEIGFAEPAAARRWTRPTDDGEVEVVDIAPGDAAAASTDPATTLVKVGLPRRLLRSGLVLVDTPGVGGIASAASVVTASSLADAHAVLFVSDVSQELARAEADALVDATHRCPHVVLVATKTDIYPRWRDIVDADLEHLSDLGLDVPILPVSSTLRTMALKDESTELNDESGFPELLRLINGSFVESARDNVIEGAMHTARRVYAHLREPMLLELEALEQAGDAEHVKRAVEEARVDYESFRERASGWQQILSDGITDLAAAVDVDLRDRMRSLVKDADAELDDSDPDEIWHEFEPTLYRQAAEALDQNLSVLREMADQLAQKLADAVSDDERDLIDVAGQIAADEEMAAVPERKDGKAGSSGIRAHQAFRAGYGGAMPIMAVGGMALGVLGLGTLVLPLAAVAGVMAGRKALTDERERSLNQRRQQAKVTVKKYTDEALFRAAAERKQAQRNVQRALRDHFGERVKELGTTRQQTLRRAEAVVKATEQERRQRLATVRDELVRVEDIARAMAGAT